MILQSPNRGTLCWHRRSQTGSSPTCVMRPVGWTMRRPLMMTAAAGPLMRGMAGRAVFLCEPGWPCEWSHRLLRRDRAARELVEHGPDADRTVPRPHVGERHPRRAGVAGLRVVPFDEGLQDLALTLGERGAGTPCSKPDRTGESSGDRGRRHPLIARHPSAPLR